MAEDPGPPRQRNFADASPREVRAALVPEEQPEFDQQWREALSRAAESLDLTDVHATLDSWRRRAWTTEHLGHERYRNMLAKAERILRTGELDPGTVSLEEIKELIAERLDQ